MFAVGDAVLSEIVEQADDKKDSKSKKAKPAPKKKA